MKIVSVVDYEERADWELIAEGAVTLFWRKPQFEKCKNDLRLLDYRMVEIVCTNRKEFAGDLGSGLGWKEQFGYEPWDGNLNALNDGLRYPPFGSTGCLALCFERFDRLVAESPQLADGILDVVELQSRNQLLKGRRLLAIVQTNDGSFSTQNLGGRQARWNRAEWLNVARTPGDGNTDERKSPPD